MARQNLVGGEEVHNLTRTLGVTDVPATGIQVQVPSSEHAAWRGHLTRPRIHVATIQEQDSPCRHEPLLGPLTELCTQIKISSAIVLTDVRVQTPPQALKFEMSHCPLAL